MAKRKNEAQWVEARKRWQIKVQVEGDRPMFTCESECEKRRTSACSEKCKKGKIAAEQKADKWLESRTINENTRCDVLLDRFLERIKLTGGTSHNHTSESFIRLYIRPRIGAKKIGKLTQNDLQAIIDFAYSGDHSALSDKIKKDRKLADKTLRNIRATIMSFMKFCRGEKVTMFHPDTLTLPASAKKSEKTILGIEDIITLFTVDTALKFGKHVLDEYIHAYRFAVVTGMRPGEFIGLQHEDITGTKVTIGRSINTYNEITDGKNENAARTYTLDAHALKILEDQKRMLMKLGKISPYIFPGVDNGHVKQNRIYRSWKRYCESNGIKTGTTPYELRHTFVSVNTQMPDALKKLVMGHSKNMDTHGVYNHEKADDMNNAATYIDDAFKKILGW